MPTLYLPYRGKAIQLEADTAMHRMQKAPPKGAGGL